MIHLSSTTGEYMEFVCDTVHDFSLLKNIQYTSHQDMRFPTGTTAYVKEKSSVWIVDRDGEWEEF